MSRESMQKSDVAHQNKCGAADLCPFTVSMLASVNAPPHSAHFSSLTRTPLSSAIFGVVATGEAGFAWPPLDAIFPSVLAWFTVLALPLQRRFCCVCCTGFKSTPASKSSRLRNLKGVKGEREREREGRQRAADQGRVFENVSCSSWR